MDDWSDIARMIRKPGGSPARIAVLTGSGISEESGIPTFRGAGGLWKGHRFEEVASPLAWDRDPRLVLQFYNERRRSVLRARPNAAHRALARLEDRYDVRIVTQNVDDLHERAGSSNVLHLHGEIRKSQSTVDPSLVYDIAVTELSLGDVCERGSQLRPFIVWFGEEVPLLARGASIVREADLLVVIGTSLTVYPAAGLLHEVSHGAGIIHVDPVSAPVRAGHVKVIAAAACAVVPSLVDTLLDLAV